MTVAELHVLLEAKDQRLKKALADAEKRLGSLEGKADRAAKNVSDAWGRAGKTMKEVGTLFTATFTTAGIAIAGFAVKASSDLNESVSKAKQVFGEATTQIETFAKASAEGLGIARQEALDMASAMGLVLQASGKTERQAAEMSVTLSKLAGDMSSFFNVSISEAGAALQSGLVGEAEPLRRFGVLLSETAVKAKAMEMGLGAVGRELTEGEKVQARYSIILEQTTKAQGDFARTSDGLANQQRIVQAGIKDLAAEIGEAFLPYALQAVGVVREAIDWFRGLDSQAKGMLMTFAGALVVGGPILLLLGQLATSISSVIALRGAFLAASAARVAAMETEAVAASGLAGAIGKIGIALAAAAALKWVWDEMSNWSRKTNELRFGTEGQSPADKGAMSAQLRRQLGIPDPDLVSKAAQEADRVAKQIKAAQDKFAGAITPRGSRRNEPLMLGPGGRALNAGGNVGVSAMVPGPDVASSILGMAIGANAAALQELANEGYAVFNSTMARLEDDLAKGLDRSGAKVADWLGMDYGDMQKLTPDFRKSLIKMRMDIARTTGELQKMMSVFRGGNGSKVGPAEDPLGSEGLLANFQGIATQIAIIGYRTATAAKGIAEMSANAKRVSEEFATDRFAAQIRAFEEDVQFAKDQAGMWADTILDGLDRVRTEGFGGLLSSFEDTLWQMGQAALRSELTRLMTGLFQSPSLNDQVMKNVGNIAGLFRAEGGPVSAGQPYIVGEKGPEWFVPKASGTVLPNGTGGGVTVNITVNGIKDEGSLGRTAGQIARQAAAAVEAAKRRG